MAKTKDEARRARNKRYKAKVKAEAGERLEKARQSARESYHRCKDRLITERSKRNSKRSKTLYMRQYRAKKKEEAQQAVLNNGNPEDLVMATPPTTSRTRRNLMTTPPTHSMMTTPTTSNSMMTTPLRKAAKLREQKKRRTMTQTLVTKNLKLVRTVDALRKRLQRQRKLKKRPEIQADSITEKAIDMMKSRRQTLKLCVSI